MIKLKNLINERKFGEPLPTLKSEMEKHQKLKEDWWSDMSDKQKATYIKDHPNSEKAKAAAKKDEPKKDKPKFSQADLDAMASTQHGLSGKQTDGTNQVPKKDKPAGDEPDDKEDEKPEEVDNPFGEIEFDPSDPDGWAEKVKAQADRKEKALKYLQKRGVKVDYDRMSDDPEYAQKMYKGAEELSGIGKKESIHPLKTMLERIGG